MNGLLIFDKPSGLTSHDVVSLVRRATGEKSVGHLGTLDPMATGVLPLMLGKWTRLAQFFGAAEKQYTGTIRFGFATDTYDAEGVPAGDPQSLDCNLERLRELSAGFHGTIDQVPPVFSAKKIGGVPAHKLARQGKEVPVKPARITIHGFELTSLEGDRASFTMHVSAGGYVRSVAHELGQLAGCGAHLSALRRVQAGPFTLADAITREQLIDAANAGTIEALLPHARTVLPEMPSVTADEGSQNKLRNGMAVNLPEFSDAPLIRIFKDRNELLGIGRRVAGTLIQPFVNLA
ncbi:tRNA pseudouridine 55 synthase [Terriglobus roseus DSM 18391]|uniref:tRNA pseudouridine synthase B n=1 Tax=Terriglobus roseus (strain DSM 18391 / NRRL B-41598 / KBS 63) TaxID=926566 RepID=I3ZH15_TERRK|nr:tRNA pseudouridine(55) synthase TruB [Terriglobus roseus]AFL88533.1 tRNA pseudouridine synthase B [Terriglobus roseus DSM 18391]AFL88873.1 tRNA pseudouridine 55 synthase [Terriglobus roseus DSM 18391]